MGSPWEFGGMSVSQVLDKGMLGVGDMDWLCLLVLVYACIACNGKEMCFDIWRDLTDDRVVLSQNSNIRWR